MADTKESVVAAAGSGAIDSRPHSPASQRQPRFSSDYVFVKFEPSDPANPYNWPFKRKAWIVFAGMLQVINSTLDSALPSGGIGEIAADFKITSNLQLPLPISVYLVGYVVGPLVFGPLSEQYGRRWVMLLSFVAFIVWTLACAVANSFAALCVFRLFCGIAASSPIVVIGGLYADIFEDPVARGKAMAIFMACTTMGPCLAPIISGFIAEVNWRWIFWVALILAVVSLPVVASIPETYGPVLLRDKARDLRAANPEKNYIAKIELEPVRVYDILTRVLTRPLSMVVHESIVLFSCVYLSLIYAVFFIFYQAYPIIFQGMYGLSPGLAACAFIPIGVGSFIALLVFLTYDGYLRRAKAQRKPWALKDEYQRLPLALIGGPSLSIGMFWLAWASQPYLHPIVPMLAGIPFGLGFLLIFMALINYLADAYGIYAASALAATSTTRSVFGAVLPLASDPMYNALGVHWATTLMAFASVVMIIIPVIFIRFGPYLQDHSRFSKQLKAIREEENRERQELADRGERAPPLHEDEGVADSEKQQGPLDGEAQKKSEAQ